MAFHLAKSFLVLGAGLALSTAAQAASPAEQAAEQLAHASAANVKCHYLNGADADALSHIVAKAELALANQDSIKATKATMQRGRAAGMAASCSPAGQADVQNTLAAAKGAAAGMDRPQPQRQPIINGLAAQQQPIIDQQDPQQTQPALVPPEMRDRAQQQAGARQQQPIMQQQAVAAVQQQQQYQAAPQQQVQADVQAAPHRMTAAEIRATRRAKREQDAQQARADRDAALAAAAKQQQQQPVVDVKPQQPLVGSKPRLNAWAEQDAAMPLAHNSPIINQFNGGYTYHPYRPVMVEQAPNPQIIPDEKQVAAMQPDDDQQDEPQLRVRPTVEPKPEGLGRHDPRLQRYAMAMESYFVAMRCGAGANLSAQYQDIRASHDQLMETHRSGELSFVMRQAKSRAASRDCSM